MAENEKLISWNKIKKRGFEISRFSSCRDRIPDMLHPFISNKKLARISLLISMLSCCAVRAAAQQPTKPHA
ncbi:MAG TPA: hypothetical protein VG272_02845, partial [Candidatus Acidoferrales bacterium]|nr:hypothetical protein [Candidatus Acidoferrales bacterium]